MGYEAIAQTRRETVENDIKDLIFMIQNVRKIQDITTTAMSGTVTVVGWVSTETVEAKNYSDYRKLVDSLKKLVDIHYKLFQLSKDKENGKEFCAELIEILNSEVNSCHKLMSDALSRKNEEQYRCLSDAYVRLIDLVTNAERNVPTMTKYISTWETTNLSKEEVKKNVDEFIRSGIFD